MALATEAAELLEIFQWMTGEESQACAADDVARARIADEIADVFIYLIRLADRCGIDPLVAASNKLDRNEVRFPANRFY